MPLLADAGYYVVACDQRGYGRTTGWQDGYDVDLTPFTYSRGVRDMVALVSALGYETVSTLVGHDMGSTVAAWCALTRPDFFRRLIMLASPFQGPPSLPFNTAPSQNIDQAKDIEDGAEDKSDEDIHEGLAKLGLKHYKWYYSTRQANIDMSGSKSELENFFRGYFHQKSADWDKNEPVRLNSWKASELAKMPNYYIMPLSSTMTDVVNATMPTEEEIRVKNSRWMSNEDVEVYAQEYSRTGFQGALNWYRTMTDQKNWGQDVEMFSGMKIAVPATYMAGEQDWGRCQLPGAVEKLGDVCTRYTKETIVPRAGHWIQQEQTEVLARAILNFITSTEPKKD